ncbi:heat shock 70 kDa protein 12A-like [Pholidichthys leucotaenia]
MSESFIIAIDFGTAYSGYAFNITGRGSDIDPSLKRWGKAHGLDTPKTPTCILFNERQQFLKFGYEARSTYTNMSQKEGKKHLYFENFKMALYGKKLNSEVTIKAANGMPVKALTVFAEALKFLKEDALKTIAENTEGRKFIASDFTWVLTVPAIWDSSAKQFMREAATKAGIVTTGTEDKLVIALEPEAASVWCKKLPADGFIAQNCGGKALDCQPGTQYIVVDCGGGTIGITVHEIQHGGGLKEVHKASGNDVGGHIVDRKFRECLKAIFCGGVWEEYETNFPSEAQKIMYDFVYHKQADEDIQISCTFNLGNVAQKKQRIDLFFKNKKGVSYNEGVIRISKEKLRSFFDDSLKGISELLREILSNSSRIKVILLVGGYAQSKILREYIKDQFGKNCKVLCPCRPQEVILKGAVQYGSNPAVVASRKSAFTFGFDTSEPFDWLKHRLDKRFTVDGKELCGDLFHKIVKEGEDVKWDESRAYIVYPVENNQTSAELTFYSSTRTNPTYVDEAGVEQIASFIVPMPDIRGGKDRAIRIEIMFGSTEITAKGTDVLTGITKKVSIDFMSKA